MRKRGKDKWMYKAKIGEKRRKKVISWKTNKKETKNERRKPEKKRKG